MHARRKGTNVLEVFHKQFFLRRLRQWAHNLKPRRKESMGKRMVPSRPRRKDKSKETAEQSLTLADIVVA